MLEGLVLKSFTRMNQRRPPQSTTNPSELAVFRKSCDSNREHDVLNFAPESSYAERQNLNIRMGNRRMTRLTNAFSKKAANHTHMMAIYFMHYNFVRIHQTLKITPAMAAGVTSKLWEMADMVNVLETWEAAN